MRRSQPKLGNTCSLVSPHRTCTCSTSAHRRPYPTGWRPHEFRRPSRKREVSPMTRDILLGIDAGTSVIKAVAYSLGGEQIAVAARPNVYQTLGGGQVEQDMHRTWADCAATLRELTERVPNLADRVAALAVTAQGDGTWLIDADGEPVGGGLLWLDSRAASLASDYPKTDAYFDYFSRTGSRLNASIVL